MISGYLCFPLGALILWVGGDGSFVPQDYLLYFSCNVVLVHRVHIFLPTCVSVCLFFLFTALSLYLLSRVWCLCISRSRSIKYCSLTVQISLLGFCLGLAFDGLVSSLMYIVPAVTIRSEHLISICIRRGICFEMFYGFGFITGEIFTFVCQGLVILTFLSSQFNNDT